jgi:hypothetical protein
MRQQLERWDPFNLGNRPKYKRWVMWALYIAMGTCFVAILLYLILALVSDRNAKLSQYSRKVREWRKRGEFKPMGDISVAVKIMPSENTQKNLIVMSPRTENLLQERKIVRSYNYTQSYFFHDLTTLYFPTFRFDREDVPVGDSEIYCVHAYWTPSENDMTLELYESFRGFPQCSRALNPRIIWQQHDPALGPEFYAWTQVMRPLSGCRDKDACQKVCDKHQGIAKKTRDKGNYVCYSYMVLTDICLMVDYEAGVWSYMGGCFEDGSPVRMAEAEPGKSYTFDHVRVQVRSVHDPYVVATQKNSEEDDLSFGLDIDFMYSFSFFLLMVGIISAILVAAAVVLKEWIYRTSLFQTYFNEGPPLAQSS